MTMATEVAASMVKTMMMAIPTEMKTANKILVRKKNKKVKQKKKKVKIKKGKK